jgi:CRP/FNR family transcriptional regulator
MADGRRIVLTTMGPGSGFGELAMLDGEPRSATIQATEPSVALRLPADAVKAVLERDPSAALAVAIGLAKRLRAADDRALGHALSTVSGRVAATLLSQAGLRREQGAGDTEVEIAGSPSDIARAVGASRAETARILHWLENDEVLTIRRGRILVHDPAALSRYLQ